MVKFALVTYLSLMVASGPGLCCCTLDVLSPCEDRGGCCDRVLRETAPINHHARGHHHHGDARHEHSDGVTQSERPVRAPCDHDQKDCPCEKQQQILFASQSWDGATVKAVDGKFQIFSALALDLALLNSGMPDSRSVLAAHNAMRGDLSGREILRAHHRLQC
jgi:hypothetical protein